MENVNHEYYVSLEVAKLLEKAGFDWVCEYSYFQDDSLDKSLTGLCYNSEPIMYAPTLAVAQRWLREVEHLDIIVDRNYPIHEPQYSWEYEYIIITADGRVEAVDCYFDEYEQALEAGIKKALELILEKGE